MAQEHKIIAVKKIPKEWESQYGPMKTWLIQVEGNGEPVQINKKADSPAPKEGDTIYGTVTDTEYGQKFKGEKRPFSPGGNGKTYQPRDDNAIRAQWAIGQAVSMMGAPTSAGPDYRAIESAAKELYAMVEHIKGSDKETKESGRDWSNLGKPKDEPRYEPSDDDINLDDIPF